MAGQPKTPFYLVMAAVVAGLVAFAIFRADIIAFKAKPAKQAGNIDLKEMGQVAEATGGPGMTTVKEYAFKFLVLND